MDKIYKEVMSSGTIHVQLDTDRKTNNGRLYIEDYARDNKNKESMILSNLLIKYFNGFAESNQRDFIIGMDSCAIDTGYIPMTSWSLKNHMKRSTKGYIIVTIYAMLNKKY